MQLWKCYRNKGGRHSGECAHTSATGGYQKKTKKSKKKTLKYFADIKMFLIFVVLRKTKSNN